MEIGHPWHFSLQLNGEFMGRSGDERPGIRGIQGGLAGVVRGRIHAPGVGAHGALVGLPVTGCLLHRSRAALSRAMRRQRAAKGGQERINIASELVRRPLPGCPLEGTGRLPESLGRAGRPRSA
ncbi:putative protein OS=Streptomyces microflavus OX=1919 GN=Smic_31130 PE=4 SV=1 [Streptomyces microflavus]|uniref:Uncharacterized protein n=1 Tax=Streptomyces microflavus TaxID=1919 RepID=A0A7J0CS30_STRMI|nr:hypothetical protein Smic_31130 [Streptomyces microflavus]